MEGLPKLLPIWHDITLKERSKELRMSHNSYPDQGGAGVDLSVIGNLVQCEQLKSMVNVANFGSDLCTLPFLSPNKVDGVFDPCLERLNKRKHKQRKFCLKLDSMSSSMKTARRFRKDVLSAHSKASVAASIDNAEDLFVPLSVLKLAKIFPKKFPAPEARFSYAGGCLTTVSLSPTSHLLLHPVGKKLNQLSVTPIEESHSESKVMVASKSDKRKINCGGGLIFQIAAESPTNHCCVRKKKKYHYINLDFSNENPIETFEIHEKLSYISMSKYIPGENLIATESGSLFLQNAEQKQMVWQLDEPLTHSPSVENSWWGCSFGSHPRSVLYHDGFRCSALDIRVKRPKVIDIFSLPNPFALEKEDIALMKRLGDHHFQHIVATNIHLFVFDERYPQQPVMVCNHMLDSVPFYCDVRTYNTTNGKSDQLILLGTQESQDIASFHMRTLASRVQPFSLSLPLHLSKPSDCLEHLRLHCCDTAEQHVRRLSLPLIGTCSVPYSSNLGYTILQVTSVGDIFYQDFKPMEPEEKTYRTGPGCTLIPPNKLMPHLKKWLSSAAAMNKQKDVCDKLSSKIAFTAVNKKEFLKISKKSVHPNCVICQPGTPVDTNQNSLDICSSCGLSIEYGRKFIETSRDLGVLAGSSSSQTNDFQNGLEESTSSPSLKLVDFNKTCDLLSQKFLKPWLEGNIPVNDANQHKNSLSSTISRVYASPRRPSFSQPSKIARVQSNSATNKPAVASRIDESINDEDVIPPSQDIGLGFYSRKQIHF